VTFTVQPNGGGPRTGTIFAAGQEYTVEQPGCGFNLSSTNTIVSIDGGSYYTNLYVSATGTGCTWQASTTNTWITDVWPTNSTGSGGVSFTVQANGGGPRTGTIFAGGYTHTVEQDGCGFTLSPTNLLFAASGGGGSFTVTASGTACVWSVTSPTGWITGVWPTNGIGSGVVWYSVLTNAVTSPRSAAFTVAGLLHVVEQQAALPPFTQWQLDNFRCTNCPEAAASADPDGDGQNNETEFLTGFAPTNSASYFRVLEVRPVSNDVLVIWATAGGRTNVLRASTSVAGSYTNIGDLVIIPGTGETTTNRLDSGGATNRPARFYHIQLVP
jgi:hypothetical protein